MLKTIALGEVSTLFRTPTGNRMKAGEVCMVRPVNILPQRIDLEKCEQVGAEGEKYRLRPNDLLLVNDASKVGLFPEVKGVYQPSNGLVTCRLYDGVEVVHPALLFAYLNLREVRQKVANHCCRGSAMQYLDLESLRRLEIPLLDDPTRAADIARTLALIYHANELRRQAAETAVQLIESIVHREMVKGIPCVKDRRIIESPDDYCI